MIDGEIDVSPIQEFLEDWFGYKKNGPTILSIAHADKYYSIVKMADRIASKIYRSEKK